MHWAIQRLADRLRLVLVLSTWGVVLPSASVGAVRSEDSATETINRVKAAFLYNFTRFVRWPEKAFASRQDPFLLGILDDGEGATARLIAQELAGKSAPHDRPIVVRSYDSPRAAAEAHLLFVTQESGLDAPAVRAALSGRPVLLVGERAGFAERGGVINLAVSGDLVRCEINLRSADRVSLKLSGRLANVARLVRDGALVP